METTNLTTIQNLIDRTGMYDKELADLAQISEATLRNIKKGERAVKAKMVYRLLKVVNEKLNSNYDIENISGLNLTTKK
jgi:predicted transcriptional regulator